MRILSLLVITLLSMPLIAENLKICSTADWPPYEAINPTTKKVEGTSVDLVNKIFEGKVDIMPLPWERCLAMNKAGTVDGVFSVSKNDERQKYLIYPKEEVFKASYRFVILKGTNCQYCDNSADLMLLPQPVGGPQGYSVVKKLKAAAPNLKIDNSASGDEVNLDKLLAGRVKSIIINPDVLVALDKKKKVLDKLQIIDPPYVAGKPYYIGVSKKYKGLESEAQKLADQISDSIKKIRAH